MGVEIVPRVENTAMVNQNETIKARKMDIHAAHHMFGHSSQATTIATAKYYGWELTGKWNGCSDCTMAKIRQRNLNKNSEAAKTKGERLYMDISSVKHRSIGGTKFWCLIVDEYTNMKWSFFLKSKGELKDKIIPFLKIVHEKDKVTIQSIRCDNAGENHKVEEECKQTTGLAHIKFEYTPRDTPQFNGVVERAFATLYGRVRSLNNAAGLTSTLRNGLWTECANTATMMDNLTLTQGRNQPPYVMYYGSNPILLNHLRSFGEQGIVKTAKEHQSKLANRGELCIFVGYSDGHSNHTYRMLNLRTHKILISRDVIWMNRLFGDDEETPPLLPDDEDDPEDQDPDPDAPTSASTGPTPNPPVPPPNPAIPRELRNLQSDLAPSLLGPGNRQTGRERAQANLMSDNPETEEVDPYEILQKALNQTLPDFALLTAAVTKTMQKSNDNNPTEPSTVKEPATFREAWDHPEEQQREKWRAAIRKELKDMTNRGVFRKVKRNKMPNGKRCVKHKWVFKVKRNGIFRARLVACGYSQIPGVDFGDHFAPVVNDVSYRTMIAIMMMCGLKAKIVDIETAFLHGDLDEEIYMEAPEGIGAKEDEVVLLEQTIYGLVQSARQFWKKLTGVLKSIGFKGGDIDPCLLFKRTKKGLVLIGLYVDDLLIIGNDVDIDEVIADIEKHFKVKVEENLKDYLSCEIRFDEKMKVAWIGQPHLIQKLKEKFEEETKDRGNFGTPGTPSFRIIRSSEMVDYVSKEEQSKYRTGVGMLLFLVKHTRPDIANCTRELSKVLDKATVSAYKEMIRIIKFVLDTSDYGLRFQPQPLIDNKWHLTIYTDSDYAGDKETRISVTGYILFFMGVPLTWKSKSQKSVTLSSSEAEYVALSEAAKEIKFIYQLLQSIGIEIELPIVVRVDNVGAIFMSENTSTSGRTKHVDVRYRYVNEMILDGFLKIQFVKTEENVADIFTKNVSSETYKKLTPAFLAQKSYLEDD